MQPLIGMRLARLVADLHGVRGVPGQLDVGQLAGEAPERLGGVVQVLGGAVQLVVLEHGGEHPAAGEGVPRGPAVGTAQPLPCVAQRVRGPRTRGQRLVQLAPPAQVLQPPTGLRRAVQFLDDLKDLGF